MGSECRARGRHSYLPRCVLCCRFPGSCSYRPTALPSAVSLGILGYEHGSADAPINHAVERAEPRRMLTLVDRIIEAAAILLTFAFSLVWKELNNQRPWPNRGRHSASLAMR